MAKAKNPPAKRSNAALTRTKAELSKVKSRAAATMRKYREKRVPNALMDSTGTVIGGVITGGARGFVPETYRMGDNEVPTGIIFDVGSVVVGTIVAGGSAWMKSTYGIHTGAGMATVGSAMLAQRGTVYLSEYMADWWAGNGTQPVAPPLAM